ncbi:MAG: hypothetical protein AB8B60_02070 [Sulfitobacter sp.]
MYLFTIVGGGQAIWMTGVGQSGGIVIPYDQAAYDVLNSGANYSIASGSGVSTAEYSSFFAPPSPNDAPTLGAATANQTVTEDISTAIDLSAYNVGDSDGDTITLTLAVDRGILATIDGNGTTAGVTIASSGTASMTLEGSVSDLDTYLNDASKITFTTAANDTNAATLTVTPNDGTENGSPDIVMISVTPANDAPVLNAGAAPVLTSISEDAGDDDGSGADGDDDTTQNSNNAGTTVADLVVD